MMHSIIAKSYDCQRQSQPYKQLLYYFFVILQISMLYNIFKYYITLLKTKYEHSQI